MANKRDIKYNYYEELMDMQGCICALCSCRENRTYKTKNGITKYYKLSVDHNHTTGQTRGLLCSKCNNKVKDFEIFGKFSDNEKLREWVENDGLSDIFTCYIKELHGIDLELPKKKINKYTTYSNIEYEENYLLNKTGSDFSPVCQPVTVNVGSFP